MIPSKKILKQIIYYDTLSLNEPVLWGRWAKEWGADPANRCAQQQARSYHEQKSIGGHYHTRGSAYIGEAWRTAGQNIEQFVRVRRAVVPIHHSQAAPSYSGPFLCESSHTAGCSVCSSVGKGHCVWTLSRRRYIPHETEWSYPPTTVEDHLDLHPHRYYHWQHDGMDIVRLHRSDHACNNHETIGERGRERGRGGKDAGW